MACAALRGVRLSSGVRSLRHASVSAPRAVRAMASTQEPATYLLQYSYVPDILEKRGPHRDGHLSAIRKAMADKKVVMAGAIADPVDGGLIIFEGVTKDEVEAFAQSDPYNVAGLINKYTIRPYLTVK